MAKTNALPLAEIDTPPSPTTGSPKPAPVAVVAPAAAPATPSAPMTARQAERGFLQARNRAESRKQVAFAAADKLPMPDSLKAWRLAESAYHTALADYCDGTHGLIDGSCFRRAAAADIAGITKP